MEITASILYALVQCPHRVWLDASEDPAKRDPVSPFVELLWERGTTHEREVIAGLKLPFLDVSKCPTKTRGARPSRLCSAARS